MLPGEFPPKIVDDVAPYTVDARHGMLPESFPPGTEFRDVEGVPVVLMPLPDGGMRLTAWDPLPRGFSFISFERNGTPVKEADFRLAVARRASRQAAK